MAPWSLIMLFVTVTEGVDRVDAADLGDTLNDIWHEGVNGAPRQTVERYVENIGKRLTNELDEWEKVPGKRNGSTPPRTRVKSLRPPLKRAP